MLIAIREVTGCQGLASKRSFYFQEEYQHKQTIRSERNNRSCFFVCMKTALRTVFLGKKVGS